MHESRIHCALMITHQLEPIIFMNYLICETLNKHKNYPYIIYILSISHTQAPPPVTGNSPLPCLNISKGHSSSIPTVTLDLHHPDTNSSNHGSSLTTVGIPTTQGYVTTNSTIVAHESDQLLACASPSHNQANQGDQGDQSASDDDDCHTDSCCKSAQVSYSPTDPTEIAVSESHLALYNNHSPVSCYIVPHH